MITQEDELKKTETLTLEARRDFMKLSIAERREILTHQADQIAELYETEPESTEREQWQGGDIVEY
jgi:hypothetical protein